MQRQSLGSPASKLLHNHNHIQDQNLLIAAEIQKNDTSSPLPPSSSVTDNEKSQKPHRRTHQQRLLVHVIPILTLLCFLILYLSSHDPSQRELAQFGGFKWFEKTGDSNEIDGFDVEGGDIVSIRSLKNLDEEITTEHGPVFRPHRKIAHL